MRPNKPKHQSLEQRKVIAGPCKETDGFCPRNSELLKGFQQNTFIKGKVREGVVSCTNFLMLESFVLADIYIGQVRMVL